MEDDTQNERLNYQTVILQDESLKKFSGGFTSVPNAVLENAELSLGARMTYIMLLKYAWQKEFCFPAQERLAADLGLTSRSIRTFLKELKDYDVIDWKQQGLNRPNIYHILGFPTAKKEKTLKKHGPENISGPDRKPASAQDRKQASYKEDSIEEHENNVNVGLVKNEDENENVRATILVGDLMEELNDRNPRSKATFRKIITALGTDMVGRLLGNTKEAYRDGRVSRSKMAGYFIGMAKNVAKENGVVIGFKTENGRPTNGNSSAQQHLMNGLVAELAKSKSWST